eukprot:1159817-Pelagomonas_calceolata.AAC.7
MPPCASAAAKRRSARQVTLPPSTCIKAHALLAVPDGNPRVFLTIHITNGSLFDPLRHFAGPPFLHPKRHASHPPLPPLLLQRLTSDVGDSCVSSSCGEHERCITACGTSTVKGRGPAAAAAVTSAAAAAAASGDAACSAMDEACRLYG